MTSNAGPAPAMADSGDSFQAVRNYVRLGLAVFLIVFAAVRVHDPTVLGVFFGTALLLAGIGPARSIDEYLRGGDDNQGR